MTNKLTTSDGKQSIYFYHPNFPLTIVFAIFYLIPTVILVYQTCLRCRSWYFLCVPVGGILEVAGYISRAVSVKNVTDVVGSLFREDLETSYKMFECLSTYRGPMLHPNP
jgi:hypothetical protein